MRILIFTRRCELGIQYLVEFLKSIVSKFNYLVLPLPEEFCRELVMYVIGQREFEDVWKVFQGLPHFKALQRLYTPFIDLYAWLVRNYPELSVICSSSIDKEWSDAASITEISRLVLRYVITGKVDVYEWNLIVNDLARKLKTYISNYEDSFDNAVHVVFTYLDYYFLKEKFNDIVALMKPIPTPIELLLIAKLLNVFEHYLNELVNYVKRFIDTIISSEDLTRTYIELQAWDDYLKLISKIINTS